MNAFSSYTVQHIWKGLTLFSEGYIEGFANHYLNFCDAIRAVDAGKRPTPAMLDFPNARDDVRGLKFIDAVVASSKAGGVWTRL